MRSVLAVIALVWSALAGAGSAAAASAVSPLVDAAWVRANIGAADVVFLDVRNALGGGGEEAYRQGHVPGAVYSDYLSAGWRTTVDGVPGQLPPVDALEQLIGGLGIGNDSHVVIIAGGTSALEMGSATRIYWTFKVLGHDRVSILDGGFRAYAAEAGSPLESGWNAPSGKTFAAAFRSELVADYRDVQAALGGRPVLLDMRPPEQYRGEKAHPDAKRPGTIPGAANLPESQITAADGRFVDATRLRELLQTAGVQPGSESIAFCNTGHWASLGWFADSEILGNKSARLYDGSMVDWSARPDLPVESKAPVN